MRFEIEDNYCIVPDIMCYSLARYKGTDDRGADRYDYISYHSRPEQALDAYIQMQAKRALCEAPAGDLRDMVRILKEETGRLENIVKSAFKEIKDWKENRNDNT